MKDKSYMLLILTIICVITLVYYTMTTSKINALDVKMQSIFEFKPPLSISETAQKLNEFKVLYTSFVWEKYRDGRYNLVIYAPYYGVNYFDGLPQYLEMVHDAGLVIVGIPIKAKEVDDAKD